MGIIPSGMIYYWESSARSIQYIQISIQEEGVQGKDGHHGGCHLALTTRIRTLLLRPHGSPVIKADSQDAN